MPTSSASDYTTFLKYNVAATSYANGNMPKQVQRTVQVAPLRSILNAHTLASSVGLAHYGTTAIITGRGRVIPYNPGTTVNPKARARISW